MFSSKMLLFFWGSSYLDFNAIGNKKNLQTNGFFYDFLQ